MERAISQVPAIHFASRVKTPYNGSFGGRGNKARLSISFPAESEAAGRE